MAIPRSRRARAEIVRQRLAATYPGSAHDLCALRHRDAYELLVATILSAQCTDERVNMVTPQLFAEAPDAEALAGADPERVEELIRSTGFFRAKTQNLIAMSRALVERFGGHVPPAMEDLVTLPGVGRKTANVVRSVAFGEPGLPVDTHVGRLSRRLGLTAEDDPVKVEQELDAVVPPEERGAFSLRLILHGRAVCTARAPKCGSCVLADVCPSAGMGAAKPERPASKAAAKAAAKAVGKRAGRAPKATKADAARAKGTGKAAKATATGTATPSAKATEGATTHAPGRR